MSNFALIGAAGYIAPRHMEAIYVTGNRIVAAVDPHDSVGILDRYDKGIQFFSDIERFDRHMYKLWREGSPDAIDYVSICSPNYLHDAHCRLALRNHADVICEKPLVINPWNLNALSELEIETGHKIYNILQLRYHPELIKLYDRIFGNKPRNVAISYHAARGNWYYHSWKGDREKSGGLLINIGVHLLDVILWLFGTPDFWKIDYMETDSVAGIIYFRRTSVFFTLTIEPNAGNYKIITIDDKEQIDFSDMTNLHTIAYQEILAGRGLGIEDAQPSIELVRKLRFGGIE